MGGQKKRWRGLTGRRGQAGAHPRDVTGKHADMGASGVQSNHYCRVASLLSLHASLCTATLRPPSPSTSSTTDTLQLYNCQLHIDRVQPDFTPFRNAWGFQEARRKPDGLRSAPEEGQTNHYHHYRLSLDYTCSRQQAPGTFGYP